MARGQYWLSAAALKRKEPGLYADGYGLYLQITKTKDGGEAKDGRKPKGDGFNRSWLFRYKVGSKDRWMGGGSTHTVSLAEARDWATEQRKLRLAGIDPIAHRDEIRASKAQAEARVVSFEACANEFMAAHRGEWRSAKHAREWTASLAKYAYPVFGKLPVSSVDVPLVLKVLKPLWETRRVTASRLRGRLEKVLDFAVAAKYRPESSGNPARWSGGALEHLLSSPAKRQIAHHAAMPPAALPGLASQLRALDGSGARGLEWLTLTATRTSETLGVRWDEIDPDNALWTIPPERMKGGKEHCVPLSPRCVEILREMESYRTGDLVFPGSGRQGRLAPQTFQRLLRQLGHAAVTVHGLRSSFRDWCGDSTGFPREVIEHALAHSVGSEVERSYRRGSALAKRRQLMAAWANYLSRPAVGGEVVVPMHRRAP